jgi:hypothetical protein
MLRNAAAEFEVPVASLSITPLLHDPAYLAVELRGAINHTVVQLLTSVLARGGIHVLVGTAYPNKSLINLR